VDENLNDLIAKNAFQLRCPDDISQVVVLHALAAVESAHGARRLAFLHEPAYCYKGFYYKSPNGEDLRRLSQVYGCLAHGSYSSWQLLYMAAYEEGFRGDPCELRNDCEALPWVIHYLNRRIFDRYPRISISGIADAWNSGSPRDARIPQDYIDRFVRAYEKWTSALTS